MNRIVMGGRFLTKRVTGVQRYARELTRALDRRCGKGEFLLALPPEARHANKISD